MPGRFRTSGPSGRGTPLLSTERGGKTQEESGWGNVGEDRYRRTTLQSRRAGIDPRVCARDVFPRGSRTHPAVTAGTRMAGCFHGHRRERFLAGVVCRLVFGVSAGGYRIERWVVPLPRPTATTAHAVPIPPPSKHPAAPSALRGHLHAVLDTFSPDCCECVTRFLGKFTGFHRKNVGKRYEAASQPCRGVWYTVFLRKFSVGTVTKRAVSDYTE